jgi:hypothetical protein
MDSIMVAHAVAINLPLIEGPEGNQVSLLEV